MIINELYYVMTRGITELDAKKLMVRARFNNILESIKNQKIKEDLIKEIDERLN